MDKVEKLVDETIKETSASVSNNDFMNHVFNFDNNTKNELMNIIQYGILSVIPIVILIKSVSSLIPEASALLILFDPIKVDREFTAQDPKILPVFNRLKLL